MIPADQVKRLDWRPRRAELAKKLLAETVSEVLQKSITLLDINIKEKSPCN